MSGLLQGALWWRHRLTLSAETPHCKTLYKDNSYEDDRQLALCIQGRWTFPWRAWHHCARDRAQFSLMTLRIKFCENEQSLKMPQFNIKQSYWQKNNGCCCTKACLSWMPSLLQSCFTSRDTFIFRISISFTEDILILTRNNMFLLSNPHANRTDPDVIFGSLIVKPEILYCRKRLRKRESLRVTFADRI